jgi:hypothetical protein
MPLQIFVEDQLNEAYEVLARKALRMPDQTNRSKVKASIVGINDFTTMKSLLDLTQRSVAAGYLCIMFIMDQESLPESGDRPQKLADFKSSFNQLCQYLSGLPTDNPLRQARVIRIVCLRCLESWLVSDPQAVIDAVRGVHGVNFRVEPRQTESLPPHVAAENIARLIQRVGTQLNKRDLQQTRASSIKRRGKSIAQRINLDSARQYNSSLNYFCDMVQCNDNGCQRPCPEIK